MTEATFGPWRKSTFSGDEGACVELAWCENTTGAVRDSKNPKGGYLVVPLADLVAMAKNW